MPTHSPHSQRFDQSVEWAVRLALVALLLILISPSPALPASFNCNKASTQNEKLICQDPWLSKLDEDYGRLYRKARDLTQNETSSNKRIKRSARSLLSQRKQKCMDRACLVQWYQTGRLLFTDEIRKIDPDSLRIKLTPLLLYQKLNLRSFPSMIGQRVKYHCETYLNQYFPESDIRVDGKSLYINSNSSVWKIDIINDTKVTIHNRITDGTYNTTLTRTVHYDPGAQDIRVDVPHADGGVKFEIHQRKNCVPLTTQAGIPSSDD